jgi:hypothetical protein
MCVIVAYFVMIQVRPFDISRLEEDCFGGYRWVEPTATVAGHFIPKTNNAYMLFYDRVDPNMKATTAVQVSWFILF